MKKFYMLVISGIMTLSFLGCGAGLPIYNVENNSISDIANKSASMTEVEKAIFRAGGGLGWIMKKVKDGKIQGTLTLRKHIAVVTITYDTKEYSIVYQDSTNLDYNAAENTIHKNYNGWIQNLNKAIQIQLSML